MTHKDITILHEDNHIIVVLKPQGVPSQSDKTGDKDMLTLIKELIKERDNKPGNVYTGLVHRLDRPTGGVMVFAKTSKAAARLCEDIKAGEVSKKYLAVVVGEPRERTARLRHFLVKDSGNNFVTAHIAKRPESKEAILDYKALEYADRITLLEVKLITGRSHQARVQLAKINCPIFGDTKYGGDTLAKGHSLALWAYELAFEHPVKKDTMVFKVYPPTDIAPWKYFDLEKHIKIEVPTDN